MGVGGGKNTRIHKGDLPCMRWTWQLLGEPTEGIQVVGVVGTLVAGSKQSSDVRTLVVGSEYRPEGITLVAGLTGSRMWVVGGILAAGL